MRIFENEVVYISVLYHKDPIILVGYMRAPYFRIFAKIIEMKLYYKSSSNNSEIFMNRYMKSTISQIYKNHEIKYISRMNKNELFSGRGRGNTS